MAYHRLDLIPDTWEQAGKICSTLANLWGGKGPYRPEDFIPRARRVNAISAEAGVAWMKGVAAAVAAKFHRETKPSPPSDGSRSACPPTAPR